MEFRPLGRSDIRVSTIAMGCWAIVGDATWGPQNEQDALAAIRAALDDGINFFDTAEAYGDGESERLLGLGLGADRSRAVIATKISSDHLDPDGVVTACERSLRNLGTETIDLYQVHWPSAEVPLADTMAALQRLQQQGKIRAIGVSNFGPRNLDSLEECGVRCESNQLVYSLLARGIELDILPRCIAAGLSVLTYSPLAQGLLTGKFSSPDEVPAGRARTRHFSSSRPATRHGEPGCEAETFAAIAAVREIAAEVGRPMSEVALAWLLHQPGVSSVLAGARNPAQVAQNVAAASLHLDPGVLARLSAATEPVKRALGSNSDLWQTASQARMS